MKLTHKVVHVFNKMEEIFTLVAKMDITQFIILMIQSIIVENAKLIAKNVHHQLIAMNANMVIIGAIQIV